MRPVPLILTLADVDELVEAMRAKDTEGLLACLAPDAELRSPISRRVAFRGTAELRALFEVVHATLDRVEVVEVVGEGRVRVLLVTASVAGHPLEEAMAVRLDEHGRVASMTLFVRAMPQLVTFAAVLGPRLARRRGAARAVALRLLFAPLAALVRAGEPVGVALAGAGTPVAR